MAPSDRLRYLASLGLTLGATLELLAVAPFEGPISLHVGATTVHLDRALAQTIAVVPLTN